METLDSTTSNLTFRQAVEADLPKIATMYDKLDQLLRQHSYQFPEVENVGSLWLEIFRRTLGRFSVVFLAEYQGEIVGFILARVKKVPEYLGGVMIGELKDMWVEHKVRRLGIGEKLLHLAIEWCRDQNVHSVEAQILVGNEPIFKLVQSLGMNPELYQMRLTWDNYQAE